MTALDRAASAALDVLRDHPDDESVSYAIARAVLMAVRHEGKPGEHTDERRFNRRIDAILNEEPK